MSGDADRGRRPDGIAVERARFEMEPLLRARHTAAMEHPTADIVADSERVVLPREVDEARRLNELDREPKHIRAPLSGDRPDGGHAGSGLLVGGRLTSIESKLGHDVRVDRRSPPGEPFV